MPPAKREYSLQDIATRLGAELRCGALRESGNGGASGASGASGEAGDAQGCGTQMATGVASLATANASQIAFLANPRYRAQLAATNALAVIASASEDVPVHCLVHRDPYRAYAELTRLFEQRPAVADGIDPAAHIAEGVNIGEGASIAAGAVLHEGVEIGRNAEICAQVVIEPGVRIGDNAFIGSHVTLCHGIVLGDNVRIQAGTVIGAEGFGYAPYREAGGDSGSDVTRWQRIAQLGRVVIGDRVEIGANTSIDRGALDDTVIESDVIIDNQVQVAHNVRIGSGTAIAGCVGIAGSAIIGRNCSIGGGAGIAGHLSIADGTTVMGMALINRSVNKPGAYASGTGMQEAASWRKSAVRFTQLEALNKRVKQLEERLAAGRPSGKSS